MPAHIVLLDDTGQPIASKAIEMRLERGDDGWTRLYTDPVIFEPKGLSRAVRGKSAAIRIDVENVPITLRGSSCCLRDGDTVTLDWGDGPAILSRRRPDIDRNHEPL